MIIKIGTQTVKVTPGYKKVILGGEAWPKTDEPYLEVHPQILWVTPYGTNDVLSNTTWGVE